MARLGLRSRSSPAHGGSDEFAGWYRVGGRRMQFYATDDEIAEWLDETLPPDLGPYSVLWETWRDGQWQPSAAPVADVGQLFARQRAVNYWIRSDVLSPGLEPGDEKRLSFSGLILVQLGSEWNGRIEDASIAIVDRIRHERTGRERRHAEYLRIFERLRRAMRKRLVVRTEYTLPDGSVAESCAMTARAADAHRRGDVTFAAKPVGLKE